MPDIPDKCKFTVGVDQIEFNTKTNGDSIRIRGIHLDQENASALTWLINGEAEIEIVFRVAN